MILHALVSSVQMLYVRALNDCSFYDCSLLAKIQFCFCIFVRCAKFVCDIVCDFGLNVDYVMLDLDGLNVDKRFTD